MTGASSSSRSDESPVSASAALARLHRARKDARSHIRREIRRWQTFPPLLKAPIFDRARVHLEREERVANLGPHQANVLGDAGGALTSLGFAGPSPLFARYVMPA